MCIMVGQDLGGTCLYCLTVYMTMHIYVIISPNSTSKIDAVWFTKPFPVPAQCKYVFCPLCSFHDGWQLVLAVCGLPGELCRIVLQLNPPLPL